MKIKKKSNSVRVPPLKKAIKVKRKSSDIEEESTVSKAIENVKKVLEVSTHLNIICMLWYLIAKKLNKILNWKNLSYSRRKMLKQQIFQKLFRLQNLKNRTKLLKSGREK